MTLRALVAAFLFLPLSAWAQAQTSGAPSSPTTGNTTNKSTSDPDASYCQPPQPQTDSRLLGPKICMTNRQWDVLHAQGLDISADGKSTVSSEKYRTLHKGPCNTQQSSCY
jgi:hypothetical protein